MHFFFTLAFEKSEREGVIAGYRPLALEVTRPMPSFKQ